jgi:hypothetical protein
MFRCLLLLMVSLVVPFSAGYAAIKSGVNEKPGHASSEVSVAEAHIGGTVASGNIHEMGSDRTASNDAPVLSVQDSVELGLDNPQD